MDESATQPPIVNEVSEMLGADGDIDANLQAVLEHVLAHFDCVAGSIHGLSRETGLLELSLDEGR